ncbi:hypothetical protein DFS34DRAFT_618007 [Phlyctochytrium arcticum]|nr:hypothetical protein DFS34DRAFT_618007 [Phlyctochytrium arcticum]
MSGCERWGRDARCLHFVTLFTVREVFSPARVKTSQSSVSLDPSPISQSNQYKTFIMSAIPDSSNGTPISTPPTNRSRRNSAANSPIIYEVNLSVSKSHISEYMAYLRDFTQKTCREINGFTGVQIFSQPKPVGLHWLSEEGDAKSYVTVHYHVNSQNDLDAYLKEHQERVASADQEKWGHLVTSRRILRLAFSNIEA